MLRPWMFLLAAPLLASACNDQPPLLAPDTTVLEGMSLHLSVSLDFPGYLTVTLTAPDSTNVIPSSIVADSVRVVHCGETWVAALTQALPRFPGWAAFFASDKPPWPQGSIVDVFVTVRDGPRRRLLEAPRQEVEGEILGIGPHPGCP